MLSLRRIFITQKSISRLRYFSTTPEETSKNNESKNSPLLHLTQKKGISKAMKAYLDRAKDYQKFIEKESEKFQIGKRHLANMMGADPETFTQNDIDNAIEYLFPSGLYDKKARPLMKPPELIFPKQKEAQFDESGRPFHYLFYTQRPKFFDLLHQIATKIQEANKIEDQMLKLKKKPDPNLKINLAGLKLKDLTDFEIELMEKITEDEYEKLIAAVERLLSLPYSYEFKDFILPLHKSLHKVKTNVEIVTPKTDEKGRQFVTIYECRRKRANGNVTVYCPGSGKITINNQDINYFKRVQCREQVLFPLIFTEMLNKVDIEANVESGGESGQAGVVRIGIALGLQSFVSPEIIEKMQIAGLLQKDFRTRERKKPGQKGARAKFTWKKR